MSLPSKMLAITYTKPLTQSLTTIPLPPLRSTHLLIKISAVALNPTDWKHATYLPGAVPFSTLGCDYAGTVISIGSRVTKRFEIGQRVYGCAHGANQSNGSDGVFAEYAVVKGDTTMRAPAAGLGMDDLATVALGSITVGQGLFQPGKGLPLSMPGLELERENENGDGNGEGARAGAQGEWLLIYGGSTATGTLAIQFAKLAGYRVVTTC
ncbi:Protein TOXD, partial [Lachnellula cervina]